jgi:hypothetical protein
MRQAACDSTMRRPTEERSTMAVTACPGCGAEMVDYDLRCPTCTRGNSRVRVDVLGGVFALAMLVGLVAYIAAQ